MIIDGEIFGPYQAFYIESMLFNCNSAVRSVHRVNAVFSQYHEGVTEQEWDSFPTHAILNELQNVVLQGAALSRYLWPVRNCHAERGAFLRKKLNIEDSNPLKARDLRNAIEHFDERLDKYLSDELVGNILPEYVGTRPSDSGVPGHFFRAYFSDSRVFRLLDGEYEMDPLITEISRLTDALQLAADNGGVFKGQAPGTY